MDLVIFYDKHDIIVSMNNNYNVKMIKIIWFVLNQFKLRQILLSEGGAPENSYMKG